MIDEEANRILQERVEFAEKQAQEATERFFAQDRKIKELYKQIAESDAKYARDKEQAVKAARIDATYQAVQHLCELVDDYFGEHAFECTDGIRKAYKLPSKHGY